MSNKTVILMLLATLIVTTAAYAKNERGAWDSDWNPLSAGPIVTWTAPVCEMGKLVVQPFFVFNRTRGVFDAEGHYKSYTDKDRKWLWQEQLFLNYGITERWEIDALGVYQQNIAQFDGVSAQSAGFADTYLYSSYCVLTEDKWLPCTTAWFQLKIPTGKYQKLNPSRVGTDNMGTSSIEGSYDPGYGFILSKRIKPFILHADAIWCTPVLTSIDGVKVKHGTYAKYDLGAEYFFYKDFNLTLELNSFIKGDDKRDGDYAPSSDAAYLNIVSGFGWSCKEVQTLLAWSRTLAGINQDVNDSIVFTFVGTF